MERRMPRVITSEEWKDAEKPDVHPRVTTSYEALTTSLCIDSLETLLLLSLLCVSFCRDNN